MDADGRAWRMCTAVILHYTSIEQMYCKKTVSVLSRHFNFNVFNMLSIFASRNRNSLLCPVFEQFHSVSSLTGIHLCAP